MKRITLTFFTVSIILFSCNDAAKTDTTTTKDSSSTMMKDTSKMTDQTMAMPDSATMMKNWMESMTPGSPHAMLAKANGTWDADITMWVNPNKPPTTTKGTAVNTMILGGRYQESVNKGMMMGMPFEGRSIVGYDNAKKMMVSSWVDNMGTGIMNLEGTWDSTTHTANLSGKIMDPGMMKEQNVRETFTMVDNDHQKMEMFATMGGKEIKTMEINFTRKK